MLLAPVATVLPATYEFAANHTLIGVVQQTVARPQDTILSLAQEFELGYEELMAANPGIDEWVPGDGVQVVLPSQFILPRPWYRGIYVNLAELRVYYAATPTASGRGLVETYPISIGRGDWQTPVAMTRVIDKIVNPTWYPPDSVRREHELAGDPLPRSVPPGEDNPLGKYALQLGMPGYFIHGTNRPYAIGMKATHGCIRMRPADIEIFFGNVGRGTPVTIQFQPFKSALIEGVVYFEAHGGGQTELMDRYLGEEIRKIHQLAGRKITIDWERLIAVAKQGRGIPVPLNRGISPVFKTAPRAPMAAAQSPADYVF